MLRNAGEHREGTETPGPDETGSVIAMMGWYGGGMGWVGWLGMAVFWIAIIALIIWLVVKLLPASSSSASPPPLGESPLDILDRRFARGEIDLETYQIQRAALIEARGGKP